MITTQKPCYPDGRLMPQAGDDVYQMVAGPFGMPGCIHGQIYRRGGKLRVRVESVASMLGGASTPRKTYQLTPHWTVQGDPEITRRREAKEQSERDRKEARRREEEQHAVDTAASIARALASGHRQATQDTVRIGMIVTQHWGGNTTRYLVAEQDDAGRFYGRELDNDREYNHAGFLGGLDDFTIAPEGN